MSGFIGRFKIIREIGFGGVGRVYCANDPLLKRNVALKLLLAGEFADETEFGRFQREVENCARLHHPNIVPLYEVGREPGKGLYMVMEFVEGISLKDFIHQQRVYPHQAAQITSILAKAVHYAHEQGIIHRDIKPQNILMRDNKVPMLTDFGLARRMDPQAKDRLTKTGEFVGTPGHMSPEQINGDNPIPQMDVYSLGCVFYELLTGDPPYKGEAVEILYRILDDTEASPSPRQRNPEIARDLDIICQKAMHKDFRKRYPTPLALAEDIELYLQGKPISARPMTLFERGHHLGRRHFVTLLSIVLGCIGVLVAIVVGYVLQQDRMGRKIAQYLKEGDEIYENALAGRKDWLTSVREARHRYEKALALDFENENVRERIYRLEIFYGERSLKEGILERAEDAVSAAEFLGMQTPRLERLKEELRQEKKILDTLSRIRQMGSDNDDVVVIVLRRYPQKAIRYIIGNLTEPATRPIAERIFRAEVPQILSASGSVPEMLSIAYLSHAEAIALGELMRETCPQAVSKLLPELDKTDLKSMTNVLAIVQETRAAETVDRLIKMLTEAQNPSWQNPAVKSGVCEALGEIGAVETLPYLKEVLEKSENSVVAASAARALGRFGVKALDSLPVLVQKYHSATDDLLRLESWKAMMEISPPEGLSQARIAMQDPATSPYLYGQIWFYLIQEPQRENFADFLKILQSADRLKTTGLHLRRMANPLASLLVERLSEFLAPSVPQEIQKTVIAIFMESDHERTPYLLSLALSSPHLSVRREAAFALCRFPPAETEKFFEIVRQSWLNEKDDYTRFYLSWAMSKTTAHDLEVVNRAEAMLKSPDLLKKLSGMLVLKKGYTKISNLLEDLKTP